MYPTGVYLCACVCALCFPSACPVFILCTASIGWKPFLGEKAGEKVLLEDGAGEDVMFLVRGRASVTRRGVEVSDVYCVFLSVTLVYTTAKTIPH